MTTERDRLERQDFPDQAGVREITRIIYEAVYHPGLEDRDGRVMPSFEQAIAEELGGVERAFEAAAELVCRKLLPEL